VFGLDFVLFLLKFFINFIFFVLQIFLFIIKINKFSVENICLINVQRIFNINLRKKFEIYKFD